MGAFVLVLLCLFCGAWLQSHHWLERFLPRRLSVLLIPSRPQGQRPKPGERLSLFVLLGQSNMVGMGRAPYPDLRDPAIFLFGNDYRWQQATTPLDNARGQVDLVSRDLHAGFGLGLPFARELLRHNKRQSIGLVPCALSGSTLYQWRRQLVDHSLYGSCLKRIRAASTIGRVEALLWFQGEADALSPSAYAARRPNAAHWGRRFRALNTTLRDDLSLPGLPVVFAQIGRDPQQVRLPHWKQVQQQQASVSLSRAKMVLSRDLKTQDGIHLTSDSYGVLGVRFARAYLAIKGAKTTPTQPR